jgi:thiol-disulfide isomerase/thioredoxin
VFGHRLVREGGQGFRAFPEHAHAVAYPGYVSIATAMSRPAAPDAQLLLSSHCPHCPAMLQILADLVKLGRLGRLDVVNVEARPEVADELGVRSVPWIRIGPFGLAGVRGREELLDWIDRVASPDGMADYFHAQLRDGHLAQVLAAVRRQPEVMAALLAIVANPEASINVRIGAGVVFEEFAGQPALLALLDQLGELTGHDDPRVRADACHYLSLTGSPSARPYLERCRQDDTDVVREIAEESLAALSERGA